MITMVMKMRKMEITLMMMDVRLSERKLIEHQPEKRRPVGRPPKKREDN
jgi:hypothetical protein